LEEHADEWVWVGLSDFVEQGRRTKQWRGAGHRVPDFLIQLGSDCEAYKAALLRNLKEALRKCDASLRRDNLRGAR
jgi:hypothetical protein